MITLYLARHGQTEENMTRIFQGHMPGTLTVEGIAQKRCVILCGTSLWTQWSVVI